MRRLLPLLALAALCACSAPGDQRPAPSGPHGRIVVGERFPEIAFPPIDGGEPRTLAHFRGKPYIVHVFASW